MLLKLIKYDLKSIYLKMLTTFAAFVVVTMVIPLFICIFQHNSASNYLTFAMPIAICSFFVVILISILKHYGKNLYGSEGYLVFTLPTDGKWILLSKLITGLIWIVAATLLLIPTAFVALVIIKSVTNELVNCNIYFLLPYVPFYIVEYLIQTVFFIMTIYFCITISRLAIWRKVGVLMGFVAFFAINIISSIPGWFQCDSNDEFSYTVNSNFPFVNFITSSNNWGNQWPTLTFDAVIIIALFIITTYLMDKKTSLK